MFTMPFKKGDVVLVLFPNSDLVSVKLRPALVVQANNLNTGLPQTIIALITSKLSRAGHASRIAVDITTPEGQQTGLLSNSVIVTDNLATVRNDEIRRGLGVFPDAALLDAALRHTFGL